MMTEMTFTLEQHCESASVHLKSGEKRFRVCNVMTQKHYRKMLGRYWFYTQIPGGGHILERMMGGGERVRFSKSVCQCQNCKQIPQKMDFKFGFSLKVMPKYKILGQ